MARINCLASQYSMIAMLHYADAKIVMEKISQTEDISGEFHVCQNALERNIAVVVTFSAMALESFFNDYLSRRLGDDFYKRNFDMLKPTGKFQMIAKFICGNELNEGEYLFQSVKTLFALRNAYVHNKSEDGQRYGMTLEEIEKMNDILDEPFFDFSKMKKELEGEFKKAADAVRTLCNVAKYFEEYDENSYAMFILLLANTYIGNYSRDEIRKIQSVQKEFKIKESRDPRVTE